MAIGSSDLALLFKLRAQNEASPVIKTAQADISRLTTSTSAQFRQMQSSATQSLGAITQSLTQVAGQLPVVGNAIGGVANQLSTLTSTATTSATSVGLVAGAAVLAASALGGTLKALFDITVAAAEFQGKMFDLSQQTGVSVETLSTLEIVAKTTGSSIEGLSASLGIFQKNLEAAQDPTSKEAALLKTLGVETKNTEEAFRQSLAVLAKMPEGFHQTATALELFGRGGKAVLAILKEVDGDLDAATESFRKMGILISTDAAKAADKFNDQLALLGFQVRSITAVIAAEAMPTILGAIEDFSRSLSENREAINVWVGALFDAGRGAIFLAENITGIIPLLRQLGNIFPAEGSTLSRLFQSTPLGGGVSALAALGRATQGSFGGLTGGVGAQGFEGLAPTSGGRGGGGGGKRGGGQDEAFKSALDASNRITAAQIEDARTLSVALKQAYDLNIVNLEDYYQKRQILIDDNFNTEIDAINREQAALDAALERGRIKKEDAAKKDADLKLRTTKAQNKLEEETNQLTIDRQKALDQAEINRERQLSAIRVAVREGELSRVETLVERHAALESDLLTVRLRQEKEAHDEQMLLLDIELRQLTTSAERKAELDNKKIESEQRYTDRIKQLTRERIDVLNEEAAASGPGRVAETSEDDIARQAGAIVNAQLGPPPEVKESWVELKLIAMDALGSMVQGIGDLVHQWVLYGSVGPNAIKKMLAAVLAAAAAQAAVEAVMQVAHAAKEFALGLATAANPLTAAMAPAHFAAAKAHLIAAAVYGGVAAVAAVSGRAIAGGAFSETAKGGSTGGGGRSGSSGGSSGQTTEVKPIDVDRRVAPSQPDHIVQTLEYRIRGDAVVDEFAKDYRLNGLTRIIIKNDG